MCRTPGFLDPGGWSKTAAVSLYFVFPGICTLSLYYTIPSESQTVSPITHEKFNECAKAIVLGTTRSNTLPGPQYFSTNGQLTVDTIEAAIRRCLLEMSPYGHLQNIP
ncbi:hypothetical protein STEG23_012125 [Scotinomys teguina]